MVSLFFTAHKLRSYYKEENIYKFLHCDIVLIKFIRNYIIFSSFILNMVVNCGINRFTQNKPPDRNARINMRGVFLQ